MASRDSAFLWETEVLRSARRASPKPRTSKGRTDDGDDWLTIREASAVTGISASTLKKLARGKDIPSHLEKTDDGFLRIVSLDGIRRWSDQIGRDTDSRGRIPEPANEDIQVDLTAKEDASGEPEIPEGTMLVPLDAWNKMLNQLGNLHEAGQQLAEARERAAKAETEAHFLKERLRELREQLEDRESPHDQPTVPDVMKPSSGLQSTGSLIRKVYSDWRQNRRR
ncbi:MAG TPA: hypothetical protein VF115_09285 [Acidimicrobiia bacterium]